MAKYLYRSCPKCNDYLGVVIPEPLDSVEEIPIAATCLRCGYLLDLKLISNLRYLLFLQGKNEIIAHNQGMK